MTKDQGLRFKVHYFKGSRFKVQGLRFKVHVLKFKVQDSMYKFQVKNV